MAKAKIRAQTACRDCAMCTGHVFTGAGRSIGRGTADFASLGITALARRNCKACGHPMSEHGGQNAQLVNVGGAQQAVATPSTNPARWVLRADGRHRWWNGDHWTDYYTLNPNAPQAIEQAKAALTDSPPRWRQQPDGRFRWWGGSEWTDDFTRDPTGEIEYVQAALPSTNSGSTEDLIKLAELHKAGVLTDDEFAAAKKKLLGL
ncbi:MAG: SHOCT domain-containing protein [Planctomycetaceae bacterium]|nr:SHOCT domain-containing protein [Planctomycetaceae bacterium]